MKKLFLAIMLFTLPTFGAPYDIVLQWDENTEPDLATGTNPRYKIYYKTDSSGAGSKASYTGTDTAFLADEGASPVGVIVAKDENDDPELVQFTLHNLDDAKTYYFAVTALDNIGNESDLSNEVSMKSGFVDQTAPAAPTGVGGNAKFSNVDVTVRVIVNMTTGATTVEKIVE